MNVAIDSSPFATERGLLRLGVLGLGLGTACLATAAVRGAAVSPEGDLLGTATFDIGVGLYVLTIALILPLAGFSSRGRLRWRRWLIGLISYFYAIETVQAFRGLDPRFSDFGGAVDDIAGKVFALTALGVVVIFIILALRFFRSPTLLDAPILRLGIRYGCVSVALAFAVGVLMSSNQGREIGAGGNLLPVHGIGLHGLQALPLVALLLHRAGAATPLARRWMHIAGAAWMMACLAIGAQALAGRPVLAPSPTNFAAAGGFAVWAGVAAYTLLLWRRVVAAERERAADAMPAR